jgi:SAM-dependent methyltransferase
MFDKLAHEPGKFAIQIAAELATRCEKLQVSPELKQLREMMDYAAGTAIYATAAKELLIQPLRRRNIAFDAARNWRGCGVELYALWQNMTTAHVEARMAELREQYKDNWRKTFPDDWDIDPKKLEALYKSGPELLVNNLHDWNDANLALRFFVAEQLATPAREAGFFDWGGGDGTTCLFARFCGIKDVHLFEPNAAGRTFAKWLASAIGLTDIHFHDQEPPRPPAGRRFGAGVCTEVLEHVIDPPAMIRHMYDLLVPGGVIFVSSSYGVPQDTHLKSNLKYAGKEAQLMTDAGFENCLPSDRLPMPFLPQWGFWRRPG